MTRIKLTQEEKVQKQKECAAKWYLENKEKDNLRSKKWQSEHKEICRKRSYQYANTHKEENYIRSKEWDRLHPEKRKERQQRSSSEHYKKNKEKCLNYTKDWKKKNPDKRHTIDIRHRIKRGSSLDPNPDYLNDWFEGSDGHHINKKTIIYIPKELHTSIQHSVIKNTNMNLINKKVFIWWKSKIEVANVM